MSTVQSTGHSTGTQTRTETGVRRLLRDEEHKMLGGVCSGAAAYLGLDPMVVRALAILAAVFSAGTVAVAYVAFWLLLPTE